MDGRATVAVIGGGAAGCITAAQLARAAARSRRHVEVVVIEPGRLGAGVAYSTTDPRHRLNVAARGMSMWPDDPQHFLRWMRRHVDRDFPEAGFAARLHYGDYLRHSLEQELAVSPHATVVHRRTRAVDVRLHGRRLRVALADGTSLAVDAVVLAGGAGRASSSWAPDVLRRSARFVVDAWAQPAADVPVGSEVVLVGAGLTMLDMAQRWYREGIRLHVVSRHGLLPLAHSTDPAQPVPAPPAPPECSDLAVARRFVFDHLRAARRTGAYWRAGMDGLRGQTADLWRSMSPQARAGFLAGPARRWDRARHRVDPAVIGWFSERVAEGSVVLHQGSIESAVDDDGALGIRLSDGAWVHAAAVVNCTGTYTNVRGTDDPLLMNMLNSGVLQPGPLDLGVATEPDGRVRPASPGGSPAVWAVGALRRGELWESIAVPEIRVQAAEVAAAVVAALPSPRLRRRPRDTYGLPLSTSTRAAALYDEALGRVLRVQSGAEDLVAEAVRADPTFGLGHAVHALLGVEWGCAVDVEAAIDRAERLASRADQREQRFIEVAAARVRHPGPDSAASLLGYIHAYPEDALAVSLAVPTIAFGGATEIPAEAWALVEGLEPVYGTDWWYLGLLAFVRQEQDRHAEAEELALRALAAEPAAGHAVHAKAHVHYETGDHAAGLAWIDRWISTCGAEASHRAHFSWHAALHELALGDDVAAPPAMSPSWHRRPSPVCERWWTRPRWSGEVGCSGPGAPPT
jgi:uncharacterized NAD(P)/FAD-binding protein YdhS